MVQNVVAADFVVGHVEAEARFLHRFTIQFPLKSPDLIRRLRLIANHLHLVIVKNTPEVRALPSTGITRPQQYYDPVRLPLRTAAPGRGADTEVAFTYACPKNEDFSDKPRSVRQPDVPTRSWTNQFPDKKADKCSRLVHV